MMSLLGNPYSPISEAMDSILSLGIIVGIVIGSSADVAALIAITITIIICWKKKAAEVLIIPQQQQMFQMESYGQGPWQATPYYQPTSTK